MHRRPVLRQLAEYRRRHPEESATVDRFVAFVRNHPDCFDRHLRPGHVTGSAWLVDRAGARVLLTHHRKLDRWIQPGGHADGNPDVRSVALAEAQEESGLSALELVMPEVFDVAIHRVPAHGDDPAHEHFDLRFAIRATISEDYSVGPESHDLTWVPVTRLADFTREDSMLRMVKKWTGVRSSLQR